MNTIKHLIVLTALGWLAFNATAAPFTNAPIITVQPAGAVVPAGQSASLTVAATQASAYQWLKDGVILTGQTNATLSFTPFQFTSSGTYQVVVSNAAGLAISLPAALSEANAPLYGWGLNQAGQLGNGTTTNAYTPIEATNNVVAEAVGGGWSLFIRADGTLWGMGDNGFGELGIVTATQQTNAPVLVASNVVAVAAGDRHSLFVRADGTLWAMGANQAGQLGNGTNTAVTLPVLVASNVVAVAAGAADSLFVKSDGTLWGMGQDGSGQLGIGITVALTNVPVLVASNVVAAAAGQYHSLFVKSDGTLWGMGGNNSGQLGNGPTVYGTNVPVLVASNVVAAAAGYEQSLFVTAIGTLWAMGDNTYGQLGIGSTIGQTNVPVLVASNVVAVASGGFQSQSLFVKADGTLWAMGDNSFGQLGNGTTVAQSNVPVLVNGGGMLAASLARGGLANQDLAVAGKAPGVALTNQTAYLGQAFALAPAVTGDGSFTYQWQLNGTNIISATNATYSVAGAAAGDAGAYTVIVTGLYGSGSASAGLAVDLDQPQITTEPISQSGVSGGNFTFDIAVLGAPPLSCQWYFVFGGVTNAIAGATNTAYTLTGNYTNQGNYFCVAGNSSGVAVSSSAALGLSTAWVPFSYASGWQYYTVPAGVTNLAVDVIGAGGGSGGNGANSANNSVSGGNPGNCVHVWGVVSVTGGGTVQFGLGNAGGSGTEQGLTSSASGGSGGASVAADGGNGGSSGKGTLDYDGSGGGGGGASAFFFPSTLSKPVLVVGGSGGGGGGHKTTAGGAGASAAASALVLQSSAGSYSTNFEAGGAGGNGSNDGGGGGAGGGANAAASGANDGNGGNGGSAGDSFLPVNLLCASNAWTYAATNLTAAAACAFRPEVLPLISMPGSTVSAVAGQSLGFTCQIFTGDTLEQGSLFRNGVFYANLTLTNPGNNVYTGSASLTNNNSGDVLTVVVQTSFTLNLGGTMTATAVSTPATVILLTPPFIVTQPVSAASTIGSHVDFSVTAGGSAPLACQWLFNGAPIAGAVGSSYSFTVATGLAGGYAVVVTNYAGSVTSSVATLTTGKEPQTINVQSLTTNAIPLNQFTNPISLVATASSGLPVTFSLDTNSPATLTTNDTLVNIGLTGIITLRADQPGNATYAAAPEVVLMLDVTKGNQSVTFNPLADLIVTNAPFDLTATASSGLPVQYTVVTGPATISSNLLTLTGSGQVTVEALQPGDTNWNPAAPVYESFNVNLAPQAITFGPLAAVTYGDAPFALTATASSGLPVTYSSSDPTVAQISGNTVTLIGAGAVTIIASQAGDGVDYSAATNVSETLTVNQAVQTIAFCPFSDIDFGDAPLTLNATASTGLPVTYASSDSSVGSVSNNTVFLLSPGTITITASQAGNANYLAASTNQLLVVNPFVLNLGIQSGAWTNYVFSSQGNSVTDSVLANAIVTVTGNTNRVYTVIWNNDLITSYTNWTELLSTNLPASGSVQFTVPTTNIPARYYRLQRTVWTP